MSQSRAMSVACLFTWHLSSCKMSNVIHPRRCFEAEYLFNLFFLYIECVNFKIKTKNLSKKIFLYFFFLPPLTHENRVCMCVWMKNPVCVESLTATKQIFFFIYLNKYHNIVRCLSLTCSMEASNLRLSRENSHILRKPYIFHELKFKKTI